MKTTRHDSFAAYVLPSVLAFALSGLYTIVDGFFIGQSLGDLGLAAITLAYPAAALLQAVGTRSEERRVGKECRIGCRSRWSPYH